MLLWLLACLHAPDTDSDGLQGCESNARDGTFALPSESPLFEGRGRFVRPE